MSSDKRLREGMPDGGKNEQARQQWMDAGRSWNTAQAIKATKTGKRMIIPRSLPNADPRSDAFRCGGRESNSLAVVHPSMMTCFKLAAHSFDAGAGRALNAALQDGSPDVDAGVEISAEWPDALRRLDKGKPDVGALPLGVEWWK